MAALLVQLSADGHGAIVGLDLLVVRRRHHGRRANCLHPIGGFSPDLGKWRGEDAAGRLKSRAPLQGLQDRI